MSVLDDFKRWGRAIKRDAHALYLASRDPRVPWYAKALGVFIAAYALSPIDLIPDFIPVLGYLDEAIILPLGIWLAVKLIQPEIMAEHRNAADLAADKPVSRVTAFVIAALWVVSIAACLWLGVRFLEDRTPNP